MPLKTLKKFQSPLTKKTAFQKLALQKKKNFNKASSRGQVVGQVVKIEDSCPRGPRFKSWHCQRDNFLCAIPLDQGMNKNYVGNSNLAMWHVMQSWNGRVDIEELLPS